MLRKGVFGKLWFFFENGDHVSEGDFGPFSNCSKRRFLTIRAIKAGPKAHIRRLYDHVKLLEYAVLIQFLLFEWTKCAFSNNLQVGQNRLLTLDHNF